METLVTQTAIFPFRGTIILIVLLQVISQIGAQQVNLDPLEFTLSSNNPKNKTLQPLPKHFDKGGDNQNDCCTLVLFFEITDFEEGSGVDPPKSDGAATFKFKHPNIRKTDLVFSMGIPKDQDQVKSRHILNFDKCSTINRKTFSIFATTNITDYKEVRVVLVNGKFEVPAIKCQVPPTIKPPETTQTPVPTPLPPPNIYPMGLIIATILCALISICCISALIYVVKVWIPNITNNMNMQYQASGGTQNKARGGEQEEQEEKFVGGDESDSEEEKCAVNVSGGDQTGTSQEEKANKVKKILAFIAIVGVLLTLILTVVILTTYQIMLFQFYSMIINSLHEAIYMIWLQEETRHMWKLIFLRKTNELKLLCPVLKALKET